jgi:hypothetical protein
MRLLRLLEGRSLGWDEQLERGPRCGLALFTDCIDLRVNPVRVTHDLELGILPFPSTLCPFFACLERP